MQALEKAVGKSSTTTALPVISEVEAEMRRALKWNTQYGNYHDIRRTFLSDFRSLVDKLGAQKVYRRRQNVQLTC